jgi:hypothetical protein
MTATAKEYEDKAQQEESAGEYAKAATDYYKACHAYTKEGHLAKSDDMNKKELAALNHLSDDDVGNFMAKLADKAATDERRAFEASMQGKYEGPGGSTELYERAADQLRLAGDANRSATLSDPGARADGLRALALLYDRAAADLERAAQDEPDKPKEQEEAKLTYLSSALLHESAARRFREAAKTFGDYLKDVAKENKQEKDAVEQDRLATRDRAKSR